MGAVTFVAKLLGRICYLMVKQVAWYKSPATETQHGLPSAKLSRFDACKDGKVLQRCGTQASSHYAECVNCHVDDAGVYTGTLDRCTVLCCTVHKGQGSCLKNNCLN